MFAFLCSLFKLRPRVRWVSDCDLFARVQRAKMNGQVRQWRKANKLG